MIAGGNHTTIKRAKAIIDQVRHDLGPGPARRAVNDRPYEWMTIDSPKFDGDSHTRIPGHCEPVLKLVWQSPSIEENGLDDEGDSHESSAHWFGMTCYLECSRLYDI